MHEIDGAKAPKGGTVLRYGSGLPITSPGSVNQLNTLLARGTFYNRVPGVPLVMQDLNCKCFDPSQTLTLNAAAWQDPGAGNWGTAAARYADFRSERRPSENISLGRIFRVRERMQLQVRAEFTNMFNWWTWPNSERNAGITGDAQQSRPAHWRIRIHQPDRRRGSGSPSRPDGGPVHVLTSLLKYRYR